MPLSSFQPDQYNELLDAKVKKIKTAFADLNAPSPEVFSSPNRQFRMRAEFRVWHEDDDCYFAMFRPQDPKTPCRIDNFPIGSEAINNILQQLPKFLARSNLLKNRLFQIEILTTLSGETLLTMIYHKKLDERWLNEAEQLAKELAIDLIGRSKKQKLIVTKDYVTEVLTVNNKSFHYQQLEGGFTQPNAIINQKMLQWAQQHTQNSTGDLLELYCGNGNFTIALAANFNQVLATEVSKTSVRSALTNLQSNHIANVKIPRMSSEEFTQALNGIREFRRLKDIDLDDYDFSTVLVDPPRAGLDSETINLVSRFNSILYISCNPVTLKENLLELCKTHSIAHFAVFDQFPYTDHIECGVVLSKS